MSVANQWRVVFVFEAILMLPFVAMCFWVPGDMLNLSDHDGSNDVDDDSSIGKVLPTPSHDTSVSQSKDSELVRDLKILFNQPVYICVVLAYATQTFVTGGLAYYGVEFLEKGLGYSSGTSGAVFGGITASMGIFGTGFGGWLLDYKRRDRQDDEPYAVLLGAKLSLVFSIIALPTGAFAFLIAKSTPGFSFLLLAIAEFCIFACISPINASLMLYV
jgi:Major Facilitator Superfamily